jgi:ABC-type multidrug transport system permease subunit
MEVLINLLLVVIFVTVYFFPSIIAYYKDKRNRVAILALNLLLGLTFIGWVVALVWALTQDVSPGQGAEVK